MPLITSFLNKVNEVVSFFHRSAKRSLVLSSKSDPDSLKHISLHRASTTRWLSYYQSLKAVLKNYEPIVEALKQIPEGEFLYKEIKSYKFAAILSLMMDLLNPLHSLSKWL